MDLGFGRQYRLLTPAHFKRVFDEATCKASGPGILLLARHNDLPHARLGLVIARKSVRHAVDRNRIKRVARESFRHQRVELGNIDIIVLARKGLGELDSAALHVLFGQLWRRLIKSTDKHSSRSTGHP